MQSGSPSRTGRRSVASIAFGRRALTERAKGILVERHGIDEARAFEMLRESARVDNRKLIDLASAVVDGHRLLPKR